MESAPVFQGSLQELADMARSKSKKHRTRHTRKVQLKHRAEKKAVATKAAIAAAHKK
jgi:hypothetical protein